MQLDAHIFKAYDIRGITPISLNETVAWLLGRAFGKHALACGQSTVAVGRDGRLSSPLLARYLIQGLYSQGVQVIDVGQVTTPMLYFAAHTLCQSGIQITGSHNPRDYNGFKMVLGGRAIYGEEIQTLRHLMLDLMNSGEVPPAPSDQAWNKSDGTQKGLLTQVNIQEAYCQRIVQDVKLKRPMKIVIDSGNGVAGASAPAIFRALGCDVVELFSQVDGHFPNHHPDPSKPENLKDLIATLQSSDAELGLAFDGDGDRLGIVTKEGNTIYPDRQMMLFAQDVLSRVPGATILFDVKCSQRLAPVIQAAGGQPLMFKTGHSLIKAKMRDIDATYTRADGQAQAALGGEMSGHIFFKERWFGFDDGTYAGARLLEILSASDDSNRVLNALPTSYSTPELNIRCAEGEGVKLVAQLQQLVGGHDSFQTTKMTVIDGLRADWTDGFGLIRASNTTPVLVLRFEGHTPQALERIKTSMLELLRFVKPNLEFVEGH